MEPEQPRRPRGKLPRAEESLVTPELIWNRLGLPNVPPIAPDAIVDKTKIDEHRVARELTTLRDAITQQSKRGVYTSRPSLFLELGIPILPARFNDRDESPPVDYELLYKYSTGKASEREITTIEENLVFRPWWRAYALVEEFVQYLQVDGQSF